VVLRTERFPGESQTLAIAFYAIAVALEQQFNVPASLGVLAERYGLPRGMIAALLQVALSAVSTLPEESRGLQGVFDLIASVRSALDEALGQPGGVG